MESQSVIDKEFWSMVSPIAHEFSYTNIAISETSNSNIIRMVARTLLVGGTIKPKLMERILTKTGRRYGLTLEEVDHAVCISMGNILQQEEVLKQIEEAA